MAYPPQLPAVLFAALDSVFGSPRRASAKRTYPTSHRLKKPALATQPDRGRRYLWTRPMKRTTSSP